MMPADTQDAVLRATLWNYVLWREGYSFDTAKLREMGGVSEVYEPAYVEDMDFGYRAWKRGWALGAIPQPSHLVKFPQLLKVAAAILATELVPLRLQP